MAKLCKAPVGVMALLLLPLLSTPAMPQQPVPDWRHLSHGRVIPGGRYCDQPYIVRTDDGAWLCVMTTADGAEGSSSQRVVTMRSTDQGRSWSAPLPVEPPGGPEASYAVLLKVPFGRVYCFYNHNTDNVREVKREDAGVYTRVDTLGHYVFRYSDDGGRSWSARRYEVPVREFEVDRKNVYGGKIRFFWNVGRPLLLPDGALLTLHKVGGFGQGFMTDSEGAFMKSRNILTERDPDRLQWETLPEGDVGLRAPAGGGRIAEEQSVTALSDGSLFCVYRTVDGYPACAYSRDGGRSWTKPQYLTYTPGGRRVKHSRAANFVWRCSNGRFLYWFHNHGGSPIRRLPAPWDPYSDRNPAWLMAGREVERPGGREIEWSQPEILLYDDDPLIRMSYPDLVEENGRFYVTETQKNIGRVHEIDGRLLDGLFKQWEHRTAAATGLLTHYAGAGPIPMPRLPAFRVRDASDPAHGGRDLRTGFTLDLRVTLEDLRPGLVILDTRTDAGQGIALTTAEDGAVRLTLNDGRTESTWSSDPGTIRPGADHHVVAVVDGGPKIITFIVDGVLCDGGERRQFGWGRFNPTLRDVNGTPTARLGRAGAVKVSRVRVYGRPLTTSEAVASFQAGR